jgi:hypothetical protein
MKKETLDNVSPFFSPSVPGEMIEGVFNEFTETEKGVAIIIGKHIAGFSSQLRSCIEPVMSKMKPGKTKLKVVFLGKRKTSAGFKVNILRVFMDGKELEQSFNNKKVSTKDVKGLLTKWDDINRDKKGKRAR